MTIRTLLLTDVVDSTKLSEQLGDAAMAALWARHDRVARDLLPVHRGREIDKTDGFLMLFDHPADALAYAVAYHRALRGLGVAARAGIHVGDVILTENAPDDVARGAKPLEVDGIAKPTAARVMSIATGGQTLLTADAVAALGDVTLRVVSHGHWRMKGVAEPVELFEAGDDDAPMTPPPDGAKVWRVVERDGVWLPVREVRHRIPAERDAFVGRASELRELACLLADARLVSVLGIGGTGKTRMVTRFAWTWLGDFPGGGWFCDLSEARSLEGIVHAVATALDLPLGKDDPVALLGHVIAARGECLIVLDNFEQVARFAADTLGRWLDRAHEARFVVTTREVLGLPGETALSLAPLVTRDSFDLFVARARQSKPDFVPDDPDAIRSLVALLDHLPLAIELAAARVRVMPPKTLLQRMGERFRLLSSAGGRHTRQATLRATFDWGWDLLSDDERSALAQLSVFEGGFTLDAAEGVLALSELWPMDAVQALVDRSWVRPVSAERFDLLVSVHEYAAEKLDASGDRAEVEARHGAWFAQFGTEDTVTSLQRHGGVEKRRALRRDLDNLMVACRRAVARRDVDVAVLAALAALDVTTATGPAIVREELARSVLTLDLQGPDQARILRQHGAALESLGRPDEALARYEEALAVARQAGSRRIEGGTLGSIGVLIARQGRRREARARMEQARDLLEQHADMTDAVPMIINVAMLDQEEESFDEARAGYERALGIARSIGHRLMEALSLASLGRMEMALGRRDAAQSCYQQAIAIHREMGDRAHEASTRHNLSNLLKELGRTDEAVAELRAALSIAREVGDRRSEALALSGLAGLAHADGRDDEALSLYEQGLAIHRQLGAQVSVGIVTGNIGLVHLDGGRRQQAREHFERALEIHRTHGFRYGQAYWLEGLARLEAMAGTDAWRALADEAVAVSAPFPLVHSEALTARGRLRLDSGDLAGARDDVDAVRALAVPGITHARVAALDARVRHAEGRPDAAREALREAREAAAAAHIGPRSALGQDLAAIAALLEDV